MKIAVAKKKKKKKKKTEWNEGEPKELDNRNVAFSMIATSNLR